MSRPRIVPDRGDVDLAQVAARLGLTVPELELVLPKLYQRRFPLPDPDTGRWPIEAVDLWRLRIRYPDLFTLTSPAPAPEPDPGSFRARLAGVR